MSHREGDTRRRARARVLPPSVSLPIIPVTPLNPSQTSATPTLTPTASTTPATPTLTPATPTTSVTSVTPNQTPATPATPTNQPIPTQVCTLFQELDDILTSDSSKISKATGQKVRGIFAKLNEVICSQLEEISTLKGRLQAGPRVPSYASVVASPPTITPSVPSPPPPDHTLLLYPTTPDRSSDTLRADLSEKVKPSELGLKISRVRTIKNNGIAIDCCTKSDVKTLRALISDNSALRSSLRCEEPRRRLPRLLIPNVNPDYPRETVEEGLHRQNDLDKDSVQILFSFKGSRGQSWVVSCSPSAFRKLRDRGHVIIGWERYRTYEHLHLPRCFRCYHTGHLQTDCSRDQVCSKCGGLHAYVDCTPTTLCCAVCRDSNRRTGGSLPTDHCALDRDCPSYQRDLSTLRRRVDYG